MFKRFIDGLKVNFSAGKAIMLGMSVVILVGTLLFIASQVKVLNADKAGKQNVQVEESLNTSGFLNEVYEVM